MKPTTSFAGAVATFATLATAISGDRSAVVENKTCDKAKPYARIINRCDYPVNIWSVWKSTVGCPAGGMVTLKKGESYYENYPSMSQTSTGVSIKISKTDQCKGNDITQLEYYLEHNQPGFNFNYLDVSYVDCVNDCPTKQEGYYLQAGTQAARAAKATSDNSWCPILRCSDAASCAKMSYILPDDVQTKTCDHDQSMEFYMCGSQAPSADDSYSAAPVSSKNADSSAPKASSTVKAPSSADYKVNVAAVTNAPQIKEAAKTPKIRTEVVYVTAYEYVNAKRQEHAHEHAHAHAHARRHQPFNA